MNYIPGETRGDYQHGRLFLMKTCSSFIFNATEVISFSPASSVLSSELVAVFFSGGELFELELLTDYLQEFGKVCG